MLDTSGLYLLKISMEYTIIIHISLLRTLMSLKEVKLPKGGKIISFNFFEGNNGHIFQILINKNTGHLETMSFHKLTGFVKIRIFYFCLSQQLT